MKKALLILATALVLTACNTLAGVGKDISAGGRAISNASDDVKSSW